MKTKHRTQKPQPQSPLPPELDDCVRQAAAKLNGLKVAMNRHGLTDEPWAMDPQVRLVEIALIGRYLRTRQLASGWIFTVIVASLCDEARRIYVHLDQMIQICEQHGPK